MNPNPNRALALQLLAKTGIWRSSYEPPLLRLLWRLGVNAPPPHFANFGSTALFMGAGFGVLWGGLMWVISWSRTGVPSSTAALSSTFAGALFGLSMASYYAYGRRKHKLPTWRELSASSPVT